MWVIIYDGRQTSNSAMAAAGLRLEDVEFDHVMAIPSAVCRPQTLDRLTSETTPQGSVGYAYDTAGRRTTMTLAGQPTVSYDYDLADRLTAITQGAAWSPSPTTTPAGRRR